jgi:hypothetical protein
VDLKLAMVHELCDELISRFDHIVILGLTTRNDGDLTELRHQHGNSRTCQGMLFGAMVRIERDLDERRSPVKGRNYEDAQKETASSVVAVHLAIPAKG